MHQELRVRLAAETASVPGARRFVCDGLADWGRRSLIDDAALCVTEMAANAALHSGSRFMDVVVRELPTSVQVAVEDEGARVPVEAVRPPVPVTADPEACAHAGSGSGPDLAQLGQSLPLDLQPMTGRGLAIVSMIAESWGVEEMSHGRRVWAELADGPSGHGVRPPRVDRREGPPPGGEDHPSAGTGAQVPADWRTVRMPQCPVRLGLRIDQHLDDLVRELQLIGADQQKEPPRPVREMADNLVRAAFARHTGRRIAQEAAAAGQEYVDVEMTMPRAMAPSARDLLRLARQADDVCREHGLLTLAATPEMESLRTWFTDCMVGQLEHDAEPVAYADWLAARGPGAGVRE